MIDEQIVGLLQRKYEFVTKASADRFMLELSRFLEWLFSEDLVRPYALQVLDEDREHRLRFIEYRKRAFEDAVRLREELDRIYPGALQEEAGISEHGPAYRVSLIRFDRLRATPRAIEDEEGELEMSPEQDPTTVGALVRILQSKEEALRMVQETEEKLAFSEAVTHLREVYEFRFNERSLRLLTSPGRSLRSMLACCRAQNPPPDDVDDWMPFVKRDQWKDAALKHLFDNDEGRTERMLSEARADLERAYEEFRALLGTSLSSVALVSRFKERCTWFDKPRMRQIAAGQGDIGGVREDRLTMELARYLHDNGVFSLVRSRMANLEPDVIAPFGPRRLAIESKVHAKGESARGAVCHGFWQLHSYLTSLETETVSAHEGFLVVFRLGGGICDAPATVALNRFRIHIVPIDLGAGESGHEQPRPSHVTRDELIQIAGRPEPPREGEAE